MFLYLKIEKEKTDIRIKKRNRNFKRRKHLLRFVYHLIFRWLLWKYYVSRKKIVRLAKEVSATMIRSTKSRISFFFTKTIINCVDIFVFFLSAKLINNGILNFCVFRLGRIVFIWTSGFVPWKLSEMWKREWLNAT